MALGRLPLKDGELPLPVRPLLPQPEEPLEPEPQPDEVLDGGELLRLPLPHPDDPVVPVERLLLPQDELPVDERLLPPQDEDPPDDRLPPPQDDDDRLPPPNDRPPPPKLPRANTALGRQSCVNNNATTQIRRIFPGIPNLLAMH